MKTLLLVVVMVLFMGCAVKPPLYVCQVIGQGMMGCAPVDENGQVIE